MRKFSLLSNVLPYVCVSSVRECVMTVIVCVCVCVSKTNYQHKWYEPKMKVVFNSIGNGTLLLAHYSVC